MAPITRQAKKPKEEGKPLGKKTSDSVKKTSGRGGKKSNTGSKGGNRKNAKEYNVDDKPSSNIHSPDAPDPRVNVNDKPSPDTHGPGIPDLSVSNNMNLSEGPGDDSPSLSVNTTGMNPSDSNAGGPHDPSKDSPGSGAGGLVEDDDMAPLNKTLYKCKIKRDFWQQEMEDTFHNWKRLADQAEKKYFRWRRTVKEMNNAIFQELTAAEKKLSAVMAQTVGISGRSAVCGAASADEPALGMAPLSMVSTEPVQPSNQALSSVEGHLFRSLSQDMGPFEMYNDDDPEERFGNDGFDEGKDRWTDASDSENGDSSTHSKDLSTYSKDSDAHSKNSGTHSKDSGTHSKVSDTRSMDSETDSDSKTNSNSETDSENPDIDSEDDHEAKNDDFDQAELDRIDAMVE